MKIHTGKLLTPEKIKRVEILFSLYKQRMLVNRPELAKGTLDEIRSWDFDVVKTGGTYRLIDYDHTNTG